MSEQSEKILDDQNAERSAVFRKRRHLTIPTREQSMRQNAIIQSAWSHFREAAPMIAFLNTHHEGLGYQPLTLAVQSDDGLERVQGLLRDLPPRTEQVHAKEA
jgi:hypothetical protein